MPVYCGAVNCSNTRQSKVGISLFRVPKDEVRWKLWVINAGRSELLDLGLDYTNKNISICADHFESTMFMHSGANSRLVWNAIPTKFDVPNPPLFLKQDQRLIQEPTKQIEQIKEDISAKAEETLKYIQQKKEEARINKGIKNNQTPEYLELKAKCEAFRTARYRALKQNVRLQEVNTAKSEQVGKLRKEIVALRRQAREGKKDCVSKVRVDYLKNLLESRKVLIKKYQSKVTRLKSRIDKLKEANPSTTTPKKKKTPKKKLMVTQEHHQISSNQMLHQVAISQGISEEIIHVTPITSTINGPITMSFPMSVSSNEL